MALIFERITTPGIAQLSYLVGDDSSGTAAVIDPRPDCEIYVELARQHQVAITHIFETHNHADFLSGARELAARLGNAAIYCSEMGGRIAYGFEHETVRDGDRFAFGDSTLTVRHTPGHSPEHVALLIAESAHVERPWGVFTGDSLFVQSAGRPDLLGEGAEELAEQLFHTLREFYLALPDDVMLYPCHGAGSACGANIGDRPMSTIGYERQFNPFLQYEDLDAFTDFVLGSAPPEPAHYARLKKSNERGPKVLGHLPAVAALPPEQFHAAMDETDVVVVDTRQMLAFGGGHIPGAINIGDRPELSVWAGQMLDPEKPLLLVVEKERHLARVLRMLWRVGLTNVRGYLVGGMKAWMNAGLPLVGLPQLSVHELEKRRDEFAVLDVRAPSEWDEGHVPDAMHFYAADLRDQTPDLPGRPLAIYCGSGYRASLAASLLQRRGYEDVYNVPGSWLAWTHLAYPVAA